MSSINNPQYKLVLYQAGLGCDQSFFDNAFFKILSMSSASNAVYVKAGMNVSNSFIDMTYFNTDNNTFFPSSNLGSLPNPYFHAFHTTIADVMNQLVNCYPKTLHVKTLLNNSPSFDDGFESIYSQKQKLKQIIGAICSYNLNVKIILVGHSQGGLVNLETAIDIPNLIDKVISISTPYSSAFVGKNLLYLGRLLRKIGLLSTFVQDSQATIQRYEDRAITLTSDSYYSNLKQRWNALQQTRPSLHLITGTSGLITATSTEYYYMGDPPISVPISTEFRTPFDGLVLTAEQKNINCDSVINITNQSLPCYEDEDFVNEICSYGSVHRCYSCPLPKFDPSLAAFESALDLITGGDPFSNGIIQAIFEGANGDPLSNNYYKKYYDIFVSDYSHAHITSCDETIAAIIGFIS